MVGAGPTVSTPPRECLPKVWRSQSEPAQPAGRYETGPGRGAGVPVALAEESTEMLVSAPPETFQHRSTESRWPATALLSTRELPEPSPVAGGEILVWPRSRGSCISWLSLRRMATAVVAGGVGAPGRSGLGGDPGGGVVVVAERLGDDGGWDLQHELAQRGGPAGQGGDAEVTDELAEVAGVQRLAGPASGEQPAGTGVGGGVQVVALGGGLQQQGGERLGHRGGGLAEADEDLPVGGAGDVVDGQPDDAGGRLGEQQHQAGGHAGAQRAVLVGEQLAEQLQPAVLGDRPGSADRQRRQREPGQAASAHRPAQERAEASPLVVVVVACQASRSAWVAWARVWPRAASQPRSPWAWVSWSLANWRWLGVRGRAWALARSRGSWYQTANCRSSRRWGLPASARSTRRRCSNAS